MVAGTTGCSCVMDTSASMESRLQTAQDAAIGFARKLREQDLAEIIDFDSRVVILQTFTNQFSDLEHAIRRDAPVGPGRVGPGKRLERTAGRSA